MNKNIAAIIERSPLRYNTHQSSEFRKEELVAFADTIIRECMAIADNESQNQRTAHGKQAANEIWYRIKNHFGGIN